MFGTYVLNFPFQAQNKSRASMEFKNNFHMKPCGACKLFYNLRIFTTTLVGQAVWWSYSRTSLWFGRKTSPNLILWSFNLGGQLKTSSELMNFSPCKCSSLSSLVLCLKNQRFVSSTVVREERPCIMYVTAFEGLLPHTPLLDLVFRHKKRLKRDEQGEEVIKIGIVIINSSSL